jgi:heme-degrading monooxygenase HmoA
MFVVIYSFKVKENSKEQFIHAWGALTKLILEHEGSLGSRLHKKDSKNYIAYAQWPDKHTWQNSGNNVPEAAKEYRSTMRKACVEIKTEYELDVVDDLLIH